MSEPHLEQQGESPQLFGVAPQPERRQLTVMFCDMVGSTRLADELKDKKFSELLKRHRTQVSAVVTRYGGRVAQKYGDGHMVYFGHPSAHEDDAERAVHAALAVIEEVARQNPTFERDFQRTLSIRIGIHTGTVVIGGLDSEGRPDDIAIGLAVNLASRVQSKAEPGQVLMTAATLRLVRGLFVTQSLGAPELAGVSNRIELHRVVRASEAAQDPISRKGRALTPFIGREGESEMLMSRWHEARQGRGRTVAVSGEAGIGKSRLITEFREQLRDMRPRWLECRASKFHQQTAYYPLTHLLEGAMDLRVVGSAQEKLAIVTEELERAGLRVEEAAPLFERLLGLKAERDAPLAAVSVEARRQRTVDALVGWLLAQASRQPTVLVVEDLHWLDPSTLEFVEALTTRSSASPLLVLLTYRPEGFTPRRDESAQIEQLKLGKLTPEQTARMVGELTAHSSMAAKVREHVEKMGDRVPLFVEEFVEAILESDVQVEAGLGRESAVPPTLEGLLTARLDRVGMASKRLAQFAAVLGRSFSLPLLEAAWTESTSVERGVAALVQAGVVTPAREAGEAIYTFRHALLQKVAYKSVLDDKTLEVWHARVAHIIEEDFPERIVAEPEQLAWHAEKGARFRKAIDYYRRAGEQAARRSASGEAIQHLTNGVRLLEERKEKLTQDLSGALSDKQREKLRKEALQFSQRELLLQLELGNTLVATTGWASEEAAEAYEKANAASKVVGEPKALFRAIRGLIVFHVGRAELKTARGLIERLYQIAVQENETSWELMAHEHFGILNYFEGKHQDALTHFERGLALYDPDRHEHLSAEYGENIGALTRTWMAWTQWTLGRHDRALKLSDKAIELAEASSHSFSLAYAYLWKSLIYVMNREPDRARGLAESALAIAEPGGFAFVRAASRLIIAWARMHERLDAETKAAMANEVSHCVFEVAKTGNKANLPMQMAHLAEAYRLADNVPAALGVIGTGLDESQSSGQSQWDSELYRIKGEIVLEQNPEDTAKAKEAESLFRRAIECADSQGAKPLKLRAALSLAKLWEDEAPERVRALIEPIYGEFEEGFDSPDLIEAKKILG